MRVQSYVYVSSSLKQNYGVRATGQQCTEAGDICAICQAEFREPLILMCQVSRAGQGHQRLRLGDCRALPHAEVPGACPVAKPQGSGMGLWEQCGQDWSQSDPGSNFSFASY